MTIATSWFAALGRPLAAVERAGIAAILAERGAQAQAEIVVLADWSAVAQALRSIERDDSWWDHEEEEREQLWNAASALRTEDQLQALIAAATDAARADVAAAVAAAMTRAGVVDPSLGEAAIGAALLAVHHRALAAQAGAPEGHAFFRKHALFDAGRWPLGYHRGRYHVF